MTHGASPRKIDARALALREEFDLGFAQPENQALEKLESMLALRFDTAPYAVALAEVAEFGRAPEILVLPTGVRNFLGLIANRGALLPAYDLGAMLQHSHAVLKTWMLLISTPHQVAFIFDEFDGHRHIAAADHAAEVVRDADTWRPLIRLSSLTKTLQE